MTWNAQVDGSRQEQSRIGCTNNEGPGPFSPGFFFEEHRLHSPVTNGASRRNASLSSCATRKSATSALLM